MNYPIIQSKFAEIDSGFVGSTMNNEEIIYKQEIMIWIQSFDLICIANPILSTMKVFTNSMKRIVAEFRKSFVKESSPPERIMKNESIIVWPVVSLECDGIRLIMPQASDNDMMKGESVLLSHFQSITLSSSPINPLTKVVLDKVLYKNLKQSYRESLKKIKLWNVQYQFDIRNVGLCTTNWGSVQLTLPQEKFLISGQNPALEWNTQSR
jgi:hypothetical protein